MIARRKRIGRIVDEQLKASPRPVMPVIVNAQDGLFPVAAQILTARHHRARAAMLLKLSDAVVLGRTRDLIAACAQIGFSAGCEFLQVRVAALTTTRGLDGQLPMRVAALLEHRRSTLAILACGA